MRDCVGVRRRHKTQRARSVRARASACVRWRGGKCEARGAAAATRCREEETPRTPERTKHTKTQLRAAVARKGREARRRGAKRRKRERCTRACVQPVDMTDSVHLRARSQAADCTPRLRPQHSPASDLHTCIRLASFLCTDLRIRGSSASHHRSATCHLMRRQCTSHAQPRKRRTRTHTHTHTRKRAPAAALTDTRTQRRGCLAYGHEVRYLHPQRRHFHLRPFYQPHTHTPHLTRCASSHTHTPSNTGRVGDHKRLREGGKKVAAAAGRTLVDGEGESERTKGRSTSLRSCKHARTHLRTLLPPSLPSSGSARLWTCLIHFLCLFFWCSSGDGVHHRRS